ncbi:DUF418 domain-containing protein [Alkalihalophilus lindianensis]|uniref:DUF418 domain-containing protein n=1 Tax=Alkalihalophilus lindianensis TaxID=1630542 RepID=A0ABU3XE82_9BACI|nr:DUF418 domain-containing protein [Alkalihalophilus lindianensis]MDV2686199.1 DUF418 domain-containing protein [Alkalihalophilus lindianensis]
MTTRATSIQDNERIASLDMMRGLALLGILLANSLHFQYGLFLIPSLHDYYPLGTIDRITESAILFLATASFYTLFSFLFGYGMALLKERLEQRELRFGTVYFRRMGILLAVGFLHYLFIWDGDILLTYALGGMLLYFFLRLKEKGLLVWSLILLLLMATSIGMPEDESTLVVEDSLASYSVIEKEVLTSGSYAEVVQFRLTEDMFGLGGYGQILVILSAMIAVIGMFLLGAFVARKKWLLNIDTHRPLLKKVWLITLLVGFPAKIPHAFIGDSYQYEMLHMTIGGPLVAMFYATSIALLATNPTARKWLQPFAMVGRLSLTNYLMQSIVFTTLFYGYGFGLFNSLGYFVGAILAIVFFLLQILFSKWWITHFKMGPFEWFWRAGTYLEIPKLKRESRLKS